MTFTQETIDSAKPEIVQLRGRAYHNCVSCHGVIRNGAKVLYVRNAGYYTNGPDDCDVYTPGEGGYIHKKCFAVEAVKAKLLGV